jgi:GMP synthase (glutamine-hydrolysing)
MERWLIGHTLELTTSKVDLGQLRADTARFAPAANEASRRVFNDWLDALP